MDRADAVRAVQIPARLGPGSLRPLLPVPRCRHPVPRGHAPVRLGRSSRRPGGSTSPESPGTTRRAPRRGRRVPPARHRCVPDQQPDPAAQHPSRRAATGCPESIRTAPSRRPSAPRARRHERRDIRLSFHPDQFVVLNSEREPVVDSSLAELELSGGGGGAGRRRRDRAPRREHRRRPRRQRSSGWSAGSSGWASGPGCVSRSRTTTGSMAPADLLPLCRRLGIPLVYDAHHHRCRPDGLSVEEATTCSGGDVERPGAVQSHLVPARRLDRGQSAAACRFHRSGGFSGAVAGEVDDGGRRGEGEGAGRGEADAGDERRRSRQPPEARAKGPPGAPELACFGGIALTECRKAHDCGLRHPARGG